MLRCAVNTISTRKGGRPIANVVPNSDALWYSDAGPGPGNVYHPPKGWIVPKPVPVDTTTYARTHIQQPGSRIAYISYVSGVAPASGRFYYWNGSAIIDDAGSLTDGGGTPYGSDPFNPQGTIVAWKHWSAVGPCRNGVEAGVRTGDGGIANASPGGYIWTASTTTTRISRPDWFLFKRGESYDLPTQHTDYVTYATGWTATACTLTTYGGETWGKRQVVGAYGTLTDDLPVLTKQADSFGFVYRQNGATYRWKNVQYMDLFFTSNRPSLTSSSNWNGITALSQGTDSHNVLFQGCVFHELSSACGGINGSSNHIVYHRCAITDTYNNAPVPDHGIGMGTSTGTTSARLQVSECMLARNGNKDTVNGYSPSTMEGNGTWVGNGFVRNNYWGGELNAMQSWFMDSISLRGGSGDQFRPGCRVEGNFFLQGYVDLYGHGGYADSVGSTGTLVDNVCQNFYAVGVHPGWGFQITMGVAFTVVTGNISTRAGVSTGQSGFGVNAISAGHSGYNYSYPVRNVQVYNNIIDSATNKPLAFADGVPVGQEAGAASYVAPGIDNNSFRYNHIVTSSAAPIYQYTQHPTGPASLDASNTISDNTTYATRAALATALGGAGGDRTLRTYLESLGHTVSFGFLDGTQELIDIWHSLMKRGTWDERYTARAINNYIREGFGFGKRLAR